jgi:subtilase family serine protease
MMGKLTPALYSAVMLLGIAAPAIDGPAQAATLKIVGQAEAARRVSFDVMLPLRNKDRLEALLTALQDPASPQYHKWLTPAQFGDRFGPDANTKNRLATFLRARGFNVAVQTRSLRVAGTADAVARNFGAHLVIAQSAPHATHVVAQQALTMPSEFAVAGAQIFSFSPHVAHTYSRTIGGRLDVGSTRNASSDVKKLHGYASNKAAASPDNRYSVTGPYWFDDLKQAYNYPSAKATVNVGDLTFRLDGRHATIAALMSSDVLDSDIQAVFDHEKWSAVTGRPTPTLAGRVYINGGAPFDVSSGASLEASLDVQQELTGAPGAAVVLYDIPDLSDGNVVAGYVDIIEENAVDVVSSSFGECELFYFPRYNDGQDFRGVLLAEHELFMQGNAQGITFLASSGDSAGKECPTPAYFTGGPAHFAVGVSTPAADPNVTAVGGTNLVTDYVQGTLDSRYAGENAWEDPEFPYDPYGVGVNASGGVWGAGSGYSAMWPAPTYQSLVTTGSTMRAVPDIGMQVGGCPGGISKLQNGECEGGDNPNNGNGNSQRSAVVVGFGVGEGGGFFGVIGTSVSSPEFAGVVAHLVEQHGRLGNVNNYIYKLAAKQAAGTGKKIFHTNIPGYNGLVDTNLNSTYSLSAGVGTPIVTRFIGQGAAPVAGTPRTPSNP